MAEKRRSKRTTLCQTSIRSYPEWLAMDVVEDCVVPARIRSYPGWLSDECGRLLRSSRRASRATRDDWAMDVVDDNGMARKW